MGLPPRELTKEDRDTNVACYNAAHNKVDAYHKLLLTQTSHVESNSPNTKTIAQSRDVMSLASPTWF